MNNTELVKAVATKTGYSQKDVKEVVDAIVTVVTDTLVSGDKVKVSGLGTFEVVERAAREGRNPQTGKSLYIPASKAPKFRASKPLKDLIKEA